MLKNYFESLDKRNKYKDAMARTRRRARFKMDSELIDIPEFEELVFLDIKLKRLSYCLVYSPIIAFVKAKSLLWNTQRR